MNRFIDEQGNTYRVDEGNNLFRGKRCINPDKYLGLNVEDATNTFLKYGNVRPLSLVTGHVSKFEYGYGDDRVVVDTGLITGEE